MLEPTVDRVLGDSSREPAAGRECRLVLEAAWHRGLPIVLTLGGGYAKPLSATLEAHVGTYETARRVFR